MAPEWLDSTDALTVGDVLKTTGGATYVLRQMHHHPVRLGRGNAVRQTFLLLGFTLFDVASATDKEVTREELQQQLQDRLMYRHQPPLARRLNWNRIGGEGQQQTAKHQRNGTATGAADDTAEWDDGLSVDRLSPPEPPAEPAP